MTKISGLIFLFLVFSSAFGQTQNLILTSDQNNKWLDSIKILPLDKRIQAIRQRLLSDTSVFVKQSYPDRIKLVEQIGNKVYGEGKPFIIIGGYPMIIDNKTETKKIIALTQLLTVDHIKAIAILSGNIPAMSAVYGSAALNGIIVMTLTKKKYSKKFQRLDLKPNY